MNKLIIAAVAAVGVFAANAAEDGEASANDWRLSVGGLARGSMKAKGGDLGSKRCEAYGADLDLQYRALSAGDFSLWAGVGGAYVPKQRLGSMSFCEVDNSDPDVTAEYSGRESMDVAYGEFRMLLVPEYALTKRWTLGARVGVAFDWVRATLKTSTAGKIDMHIPGSPTFVQTFGPYAESERFTDFVTQAILGLETTYMLTDCFGLYANIDYRCGGNAKFSKDGEQWASLNMDGWCAGVGAVVSF